MTVVRRRFIVVAIIVLAAVGSGFASASNIYITQNGSPTGNCTSNVQTPDFFNNPKNWGNGAGQIGPGTTVLLCGTFKVADGGTLVTTQGNGSSANPILIQLDTNALLQSNYFSANGAIYVNGNSYITIDGGSTTACGWVGQAEATCNGGIIQNLLNGGTHGTCLGGACTYHNTSAGIFVNSGSSNIEIRNLTIQHIYDEYNSQAEGSAGNDGTFGILANGPVTNLHVHNNWLTEAAHTVDVEFGYGSATNVEVDHNYLAHHAWAVGAGSWVGSVSGSFFVHDNEITNWNDWNQNFNTWHTDGLHAYTVAGSGVVGVYFYNNFCHGALSANTSFAGTGYAYFDLVSGEASDHQSFYVFNNVMDASTTDMAAWTTASSLNGVRWYNNTLIGQNAYNGGQGTNGLLPTSGARNVSENNIFAHWYQWYQAPYSSLTSSFATSDYNVMYDCTNCFEGPSGGTYTWAQWQGLGFDTHSRNANPNLSSSYMPSSGSPAIGAGTNLGNLCQSQPIPGIGALCYDVAGNLRPASGNWDAGAYQYGAGGLNPPTGLTATVK